MEILKDILFVLTSLFKKSKKRSKENGDRHNFLYWACFDIKLGLRFGYRWCCISQFVWESMLDKPSAKDRINKYTRSLVDDVEESILPGRSFVPCNHCIHDYVINLYRL